HGHRGQGYGVGAGGDGRWRAALHHQTVQLRSLLRDAANLSAVHRQAVGARRGRAAGRGSPVRHDWYCPRTESAQEPESTDAGMVLRFLHDRPETLSALDVADGTGISRGTARRYLE